MSTAYTTPQSLRDNLKIDPESPSGLTWTTTHGKRRAGNRAGSRAHGYWIVGWQGTTYRVHRVLWEMLHGPVPDGLVIDHKDGDRSNNNHRNLRLVTTGQNNMNTAPKDGRELPKNVYSDYKGQLFVVVQVDGVRHKQLVDDVDEGFWVAHLMREKLHGEFARDF